MPGCFEEVVVLYSQQGQEADWLGNDAIEAYRFV